MQGSGFSLSIYSPSQIMKMGTSVDYGVCKGRRADGMSCTLVINKYENEKTSILNYLHRIAFEIVISFFLKSLNVIQYINCLLEDTFSYLI